MAKIRDLLARGRTSSFELFPPRSDEAQRDLERTLRELETLRPSFVSVTSGAGGSTRDRTRELVRYIHRETSMTPMAHVTVAGRGRAQLEAILRGYRDEGIENILALGGDPPRDPPGRSRPRGELRDALELVELVRSVGDFSVGVAAHPAGHPRAPDLESDRRWTAEKLARADFAITQLLFDVDAYRGLVDDLARLGCHAPVIPGVMPITSGRQIDRLAELSGAELPADLVARVRAAEDDPAAVRAIGVDAATEVCARVLDAGAPGVHLYTLNRSTATREIHTRLGLGPSTPSRPRS